MVEQEGFRKDLYYRISTFPIHLPSLAERREDIPLLAATLLARINPAKKLQLHPDTLVKLQSRYYPGNIRELRNILERASLMADSNIIMPAHLAMDDCAPYAEEQKSQMAPAIVTLEQAEQQYLKWASTYYQGDRRMLAKMLGDQRAHLVSKTSGVICFCSSQFKYTENH
jgi:DNA-binding NtrC family response regulator